jgi:hypothetical protein
MTRPMILLLERTQAARDAMHKLVKTENCEVVSSETFAEGLNHIYEEQGFDALYHQSQDTTSRGSSTASGCDTCLPTTVPAGDGERFPRYWSVPTGYPY